jgi:V/A-type H+-transporting ATPase subunit C
MNAQFVRIFGFSTVIAIVRLLDYEIRNLSSIAFGVEQGIPSQAVMDRIIVKES